jgi:hypothetical protein
MRNFKTDVSGYEKPLKQQPASSNSTGKLPAPNQPKGKQNWQPKQLATVCLFQQSRQFADGAEGFL